MHVSHPSLFSRHDTFFGVCEGLGEDFGFNANYLRIAVGVGVLFNLVAALGVYFGLGFLLVVSRWIFPSRPIEARTSAVTPVAGLKGDNDEASIEFATAA